MDTSSLASTAQHMALYIRGQENPLLPLQRSHFSHRQAGIDPLTLHQAGGLDKDTDVSRESRKGNPPARFSVRNLTQETKGCHLVHSKPWGHLPLPQSWAKIGANRFHGSQEATETASHPRCATICLDSPHAAKFTLQSSLGRNSSPTASI
jgi:hypothetical protein